MTDAQTTPVVTETGETPTADTSVTPEGNQGLVEVRDRYRGERDSAREALTAAEARIVKLQRAEIERLAEGALSHPADVFTLSGNDVADYLNDGGEVDPEKVAADVAAILAERPGMGKIPPAIDPSQGHGSPLPKGTPSFAAMIHSAARR